MKQYNIYENPEGLKEAVKQGWSWPGFCFTWLWCFSKKLNGYGFMFLVYVIVSNILARTVNVDAVVGFVLVLLGLGISMWMGSSGNQLREENLKKLGWEKKNTINAATPDGAIAIYYAKEEK